MKHTCGFIIYYSGDWAVHFLPIHLPKTLPAGPLTSATAVMKPALPVCFLCGWDALGSYLSVALEVGMGQLGVGELQQSQRDRSRFRFGINVPNRTVILTVRCVRRPAGKAERSLKYCARNKHLRSQVVSD